MRNTKFCNIRFNLDNPTHRKAWEYLQTMNRDKYKSYSNTVINAINSYFENEYNDNAEETEWEKRLDDRIMSAIKKGFDKVVSNGAAEHTFNDDKSELSAEDIDWDYLDNM